MPSNRPEPLRRGVVVWVSRRFGADVYDVGVGERVGEPATDWMTVRRGLWAGAWPPVRGQRVCYKPAEVVCVGEG